MTPSLRWTYDCWLATGRSVTCPDCRRARLPSAPVRGADAGWRKGVGAGVAEVRVQEGESIEGALRRFKRKVQQEDIIKDIKKHSFYLKPGDKRRAKQALARKRSRKKMRREAD